MYRLGFDIGGSKIAAGVIDENMRVVARRTIPFPLWEPVRLVCEEMRGMAEEMAAELDVSPEDFGVVGAAVPGSLDPKEERVIHAYNLGFHDVPLRVCLREYFPGADIFLANDGDAAALAELYRGSFHGCKTAVLFTLGTGVGGGLILGGKLFTGGMGHGVEIGHMPMNCGGEEICTCGNTGCIEALCSATWILTRGKEAMKNHPRSLLGRRAGGREEAMTAKIVMDCAREGDEAAWSIFEQYLENLSGAIAGIANLLDPEVIALGGGVSLAGEFLLAPLREKTVEKTFFKYPYRIVSAYLGNDAGMIGAALLGDRQR